MPELPDVAYFSDYANRTSLNQRITGVECRNGSLIKNLSCRQLVGILKGEKFKTTWRRGKVMIAEIAGTKGKLVFHFGMTGGLEYGRSRSRSEGAQKFGCLIIQFKNGKELVWLNKRKLGKIYWVRQLNQVPLLKTLGREPLELFRNEFFSILDERTGNIKALLMDQKKIAGIGNAYSNEILFRANIRPGRKTRSLGEGERNRLYSAMKKTLRAAIRTEPPKGELPRSWLAAHLKDMRFPKNKRHRLEKEKIAGRSAVFCPVHQR